MKALLFAPLIVLMAQSSSATSFEATKACGTIEIQEVVCKKAPCYPLVKMETASGLKLTLWSTEEIMALLSELNGKLVCVEGGMSSRSSLVVYKIEAK